MTENPMISQMRVGGILHDIKDTYAREQCSQLSEQIRDLPSGGMDLSGYVASPSSGEVGQVLAIKTTDSTGKPIEYEAIDVIDSDVETELYNVIYGATDSNF